jgi:ATP-dependent DNA helicase RecQ
VARETLGYDRLRPGQADAIEAVIEGRDTLAVLPTGLGKSAIYQLAGMQIEGATVVISPLIALQQDQVQSIREQEIAGVAAINSTMAEAARDAALDAAEADGLEFLFLAPEQLANEEVRERLRAIEPSLFVVDEAHCISEWGHDFRPDYLRLGPVIEELGHPVVLALTATASPPVRTEIVEQLGMEDVAIVVRGFDRPNIHLAVEAIGDDWLKREALIERVAGIEGSGIVYAATRRTVEELAEALRDAGIGAAAYHGGMAAGVRERTQDAFMSGETRVIVATTAFGMGVDKQDVRFVLHYDISDSLDAYFQELGRGGRDGEPAEALLLYRPEDLGIRRFFGGRPELDGEELAAVAGAVADDGAATEERVREETDLGPGRVSAALGLLSGEGLLDVSPGGGIAAEPGIDAEEAAEAALARQERQHEYDRTRLEMLRAYAETRECRREFLLTYFGEPFAGPCGNCDNCESPRENGAVEEPSEQPFAPGTRVRHASMGGGQVLRYERDRVVVLFDDAGYRVLGLAMVRDQDLLQPE